MTTIRTERPLHCTITIWHGEDWYEAVPQWVDPRDNSPVDISGMVFELFCRPSFDHATRFLLATSVAEAGIYMDNALTGLMHFFLSQAAIEAALPVSNSVGWKQFLRVTFNDLLDHGAVTKHLWTGPLLVLPARDAA